MNKSSVADNPMRLLGVFAHPDDEAFCAGGTFAKYVAAGAEVMVISATRGEAGQIRSARAATRQMLAQVREQELQQACQRLGIQHAVCLDYADGRLQDVEQAVLTRQIGEIIHTFQPDLIIVHRNGKGWGAALRNAWSAGTNHAERMTFTQLRASAANSAVHTTSSAITSRVVSLPVSRRASCSR